MMSSGIRQFVSEESCEESFCCHFVIVVLQKDVMVVKGDANEDVIFWRLISYNFNGFKTAIF